MVIKKSQNLCVLGYSQQDHDFPLFPDQTAQILASEHFFLNALQLYNFLQLPCTLMITNLEQIALNNLWIVLSW